jgi:DNA polymerase III epsilon subunit-like protein
MGQRLIEAVAGTTFVVIDFEYTTPSGASAEPIEVAAMALRVQAGQLVESGCFEALIHPPAHAAPTAADAAQTGITAAMLSDAPSAAEVLAALDRRFTAGPYVLVAHHAPAEARILTAYRQHCPHLARLDFLDTVRLARAHYPDLPRHSLDELLGHLRIAIPSGRHRAMTDVRLTAEVFRRMVADSAWATLAELRSLAGYTPASARPEQTSLFG